MLCMLPAHRAREQARHAASPGQTQKPHRLCSTFPPLGDTSRARAPQQEWQRKLWLSPSMAEPQALVRVRSGDIAGATWRENGEPMRRRPPAVTLTLNVPVVLDVTSSAAVPGAVSVKCSVAPAGVAVGVSRYTEEKGRSETTLPNESLPMTGSLAVLLCSVVVCDTCMLGE